MNANELMIGDWVQHTSGKYMQVTAIDAQRGFACDIPHGWSYNNEYVPISLTAEILEKNGFWHEQNVGWVLDCYEHEVIYDSFDRTLRINYNRKTILDLEFFGQMSVSELQHALRLCEIEKEIEL